VLETALVFVIHDAEPFEAVRRDYAPGEFARGIPFHITLLYPFAPPGELTADVIGDARAFFTQQRAVELELVRLALWPSVVYAVPEPEATLRACMTRLHALFSQWPPYGGEFDEVVPHATLGEDIDAEAAYPEIERRLSGHLPLRRHVHSAVLLEEFAPDRWRERERFPLGG
jgi:2'-5' RNA ligase